jgi:cytochrome c oxidase subunit 2
MKSIELIMIGMRLIVTVGVCVTVLAWSHSAVVAATPAAQEEQVIHITAKKFAYSPNEIILKKGVPVVLELTSLDRVHGFRLVEFGIRAEIKPGEVTQVHLVPSQTGRFAFACDVFCGVDHDEMAAELVVVD